MSSPTRLAIVIILGVLTSTMLCAGHSTEMEEESRGKKKGKYNSLLIGALLIKAIIFPIAFKAMAFMSTISVVLSVLSLLTASVMGYSRVASREHYPSPYKHIYLPRHKKRKEFIIPDGLENNDNMISSSDTNEELTQYNQNNPEQRTSIPYYYYNNLK